MSKQAEFRRRAFWSVALALALLLAPAVTEAKKRKKRDAEPPAAQAAPAAPPVDYWSALNTANQAHDAGDLEKASALYRELLPQTQDALVWCYSRLGLTKTLYALAAKHAPDASPDVRQTSYEKAIDMLGEALKCTLSQEPAAGDQPPMVAEVAAAMTPEEQRITNEFADSFGAKEQDDIREDLAAVSKEAATFLSDGEMWLTAILQWQAHMDAFGPSAFAQYNVAMACLESGDTACALDRVRAASEAPSRFGEPAVDPYQEAVARAFAIADRTQQAKDYHVAFDLLAEWHEQESYSIKPAEVVENRIVSLEPDRRHELLSGTDACWVVITTADLLRDAGRDFEQEARQAAGCGEHGAEAQALLDETTYERVREDLRALQASTSSSERSRLIARIEKAAGDIQNDKTRADVELALATERSRYRSLLSDRQEQKVAQFNECTDLLGMIEWKRRRDQLTDDEVAALRRNCCSFLRTFSGEWKAWLHGGSGRTFDESQIEEKQQTLDRFCR